MEHDCGLEKALEEIDKEIAELVKKRASMLRGIDYSEALSILTGRRSIVADRISLEYGLPRDYALHLLALIDGVSLNLVKPLRVGFLGPRGSFTEEAALKMFGDMGATLVQYQSIADVFRAVETGETDYGVVPLENSIEGSVGETLDMLARTPTSICGETEVKISLCLIARPGTKLSDIKTVLSHPMALAQCRGFIYSKLRNVRIETRSSTAEAVKEAVETPGIAAIGSELAARIYCGEVLARGLEDHRENYTRFIAIGFKPLDKGVDVKTSLIFTLEDVPGALYRALEPFAKRGINLSKIESRPIKDRPWEYAFFVDISGSAEDPGVREAINELSSRATVVRILGSYRKIL